jgi:hypothetical protein
MRSAALGFCVVLMAGCASQGLPSTDTSSSSLPSLETKVQFLERYVTFRRGYEALEFHVTYRNGGSFPPGPSEWDIRLVARVPPAELASWVPERCAPTASADTTWLGAVPGAEEAADITEWYIEPRRVVGIGRRRSVVAYRCWTR